MKNILITLLTFLLASCGGGGGGGGSQEIKKSLFSKWESESMYLDFSNGEFNTNKTIYLYLPITSFWITALNNAGRDTTGMIAGTYYLCEMEIYFTGDESSGNIATNHDDIDTPAHNACLEWDNNCSLGVCNFSSDHLYTIEDNVLKIDYFGTADSNTYGTGSFN